MNDHRQTTPDDKAGGKRRPASRDDEAVKSLERKKTDQTHQDELLDEGVEETFPASDPVSVKRIT